ncbi:hypothetical protein VSR01_16545 [Actinacidiphila sp. DG2A-62]|uniref:hypothetical protein n=1 Tax=Actinacidiphila sp. DG2A-62 TaxID=3108821 RepID=UPI002DBA6781|nr:hypothetical protein [Actinacidiphila sp. DG2A-62]MEC3995056.1 hypothetical protein [Actinacidiphila sp. DG2A-62]
MQLTRTAEEITARASATNPADPFGWTLEVLLPYLEFDAVRPFLKAETTEQDWADARSDAAALESAARAYYLFALDKIADQRGISADRSVIKLREYAWLAGRDDVVAAMDAAEYPEYGAPKVRVFGEAFGFTDASARS